MYIKIKNPHPYEVEEECFFIKLSDITGFRVEHYETKKSLMWYRLTIHIKDSPSVRIHDENNEFINRIINSITGDSCLIP